MPELLSAKIVINEEQPTIPNFPALPTAVPAFMGIAEKGPVMVPTLITSFDEYQEIFGGFLADYTLAVNVRAFFLGGGNYCYVSRILHLSNLSSRDSYTATFGDVTLQNTGSEATTASFTGTESAPFTLQAGDTLIASVDGIGDQTATFTATAGSEEGDNIEMYAISDGDTLIIEIDGGSAQTITLAGLTGGAATAEEVSQSINDQLFGGRAKVTTAGTKVTLESDKLGTDSSVQVTGGTAASAIGFDGALHSGTGNVADVSAVTVSEIETIVEAAWTNGGGVSVTASGSNVKIETVDTGSGASIILGAGTANAVLGFTAGTYTGSDAAPADTLTFTGKYPGSYTNVYSFRVEAASNGDADYFNLHVMRGTTYIESYYNTTMDSTDDNYIETVFNDADAGSTLFVAEDLELAGTAESRKPATVSNAPLDTDGTDDLASLTDNDFLGSQGADTGFYAFDENDEITLMACSDNTNSAVQVGMITYCGSWRNGLIIPIVDCPEGVTYAYMKDTYVSALGSAGSYKNYGILAWPRLKIINPSVSVYGSSETITIPYSGAWIARMSVNDANLPEGPFAQPSNVVYGQLTGIIDIENTNSNKEVVRDLVYPLRINPIRTDKTYGVYVDGSRTLDGTAQFPSIGERRGVSNIEKLLKVGMPWIKHRNNTAKLRNAVANAITDLLLGFTAADCFASDVPDEAFFVDVSDALNPPSVTDQGKLIIRVGLATARPSEFIIIKVSRDTRALEQSRYQTGS